MLAYAHGTSSTPLLGQTIGANFLKTVERSGDREALVDCSQGYRATYTQLSEQVERLARALLALEVRVGDRVGIWSPNRYEWVVVQYATARVGAILVNVNPAYRTNELAYALRQSGISVLFRAGRFRQNEYAPMVEAARADCPELCLEISLDRDWDEVLAKGDRVAVSELHAREATLSFDDPINIQYTSGTTGFPKGATLSHHNILNNALFVGETLGYSERDRVCIPVPFYHCFGMVLGNLACTSHGACMVIPGEAFSPTATLDAVHEERCTSLYGVPTMFRAMIDEENFASRDYSSLRTGVMAGSPCPIELMREVATKLHMPEVTIGYGMTETSPISTMSDRDDPLEKRVSTVGRVRPFVELCIQDPETHRIVVRGESGEFCARGYHVMRGYWNADDATRQAIDDAGWMHSGDLAVMDEEGYVRIVGRLKDMIIRGGENISPREIEATLEAHPAVAEVQVVGVPSPKYGEEVMAWVRLRAEHDPDEETLRQYCQEKLAHFKVPKYWQFVDSFPMTVTGKIQKFKLRQMALEVLGIDSPANESG